MTKNLNIFGQDKRRVFVNLKVKNMVEIIEVHSWDAVTRNSSVGLGHDLFSIRVKDENTFMRIAETYNIPFVFKKGKELVCINSSVLYWYK